MYMHMTYMHKEYADAFVRMVNNLGVFETYKEKVF